jgi:hypothetical protein
MIYWHVDRKSTCIYSQLKRCSSSEVAAMVEGVEGLPLIPTFRITSATGTPSSACFTTATICSTENRFFFIQNPPSDFAED